MVWGLRQLANAPLAAFALAATGLAGCTHSVDLVPLDGGRPGIGDVGRGGNRMLVHLAGPRYTGRFIPPTDSKVAALDAPAELVEGPVATGRYYGVHGRKGPTGAILTARDGSTIACRF